MLNRDEDTYIVCYIGKSAIEIKPTKENRFLGEKRGWEVLFYVGG